MLSHVSNSSVMEKLVNSINSRESTDWIANAIECVRKKGVILWATDSQLHYRAPKGALTREEIERLRVSRGQIVAFLEGAASAEGPRARTTRRPCQVHAPLAFSQLAHWHMYKLGERPSLCNLASATRVCGRLN